MAIENASENFDRNMVTMKMEAEKEMGSGSCDPILGEKEYGSDPSIVSYSDAEFLSSIYRRELGPRVTSDH